ncbi:DUF3631 domain-containing protein [Sphingobium sp. D43FB]|nr:DUF3631 domain-containing protein [Sphingobium sp. D43FB]
MTEMDVNEGTGAVTAATGPKVATAPSRATSDSSNEHSPPDDKAGDIDGANLLDRIHAFLGRFICYPSAHAHVSHALWVVHAHLMDAWFTTPRLAVLSPEPGSGKSRVLEVTALMVPNALLSSNASAAYILRRVADQENRPTILYDEIDTIFGPTARGNEELRGMFNAGYRRGASVGRCYVDRGKVVPEELATFAALAMGGLGHLPGTIMSRSIIIRMRKRTNGERVEPFQPRLHESQADGLRDELATWAASVASAAEVLQPILPDCIADRNADVWGPLITVADLAGGIWPDAARSAAIHAVASTKANERPSLGVQLLAEIRACFGDADRMTTADLLDKLLEDDEAPWGDLRGRKLDARKLAEMLREYGIRSSSIRMPSGQTPKGYKRDAFHEAWRCYLPVSQSDATDATCATDNKVSENPIVRDKAALSPCGGYEDDAADSGG